MAQETGDPVEPLLELADRLTTIYFGDGLAKQFNTPIEERDVSWNKAAEEFPLYREKIMNLHALLKRAEDLTIKFWNSSDMIKILPIHFRDFTDESVRDLLTSILLAKANPDDNVSEDHETYSPIIEDIQYSIYKATRKEFSEVDCNDVFKAILEGKLEI